MSGPLQGAAVVISLNIVFPGGRFTIHIAEIEWVDMTLNLTRMGPPGTLLIHKEIVDCQHLSGNLRLLHDCNAFSYPRHLLTKPYYTM